VDAGKADHYCVVIDADEQRLELPLKSWRVLYVTGLPGVILARWTRDCNVGSCNLIVAI
jgi:hypothetical protein